jgi:hypothetical protein
VEDNNVVDFSEMHLKTDSELQIVSRFSGKNVHADSATQKMYISITRMKKDYSGLYPSRGKLFRVELQAPAPGISDSLLSLLNVRVTWLSWRMLTTL